MENKLRQMYPGDWSTPTPVTTIQDPNCGETFDIIACFGNWHVSTIGDVIYYKEDTNDWYLIPYKQLFNDDNDDWVLHLCEKGWFDTVCYECFKRAYFLGCRMCGARPQHQIRDYSERRKRQQPGVKNATPKSVPGAHDLASEMINTGLDMLTDVPEDTQISSLLNAAHVMFTGILLSETVKERALKVVEHYYHKDMSLLAEIPEEHYGGYKKHQN